MKFIRIVELHYGWLLFFSFRCYIISVLDWTNNSLNEMRWRCCLHHHQQQQVAITSIWRRYHWDGMYVAVSLLSPWICSRFCSHHLVIISPSNVSCSLRSVFDLSTEVDYEQIYNLKLERRRKNGEKKCSRLDEINALFGGVSRPASVSTDR